MYASIDAAADKIEKQLKKHKEKLFSHKATPVAELPPVEVRHDVLAVAESPLPGQARRRVVRSTEFQARPMTVDEAIMQLELLDSHFYVFQNASDRSINVVFRRPRREPRPDRGPRRVAGIRTRPRHSSRRELCPAAPYRLPAARRPPGAGHRRASHGLPSCSGVATCVS